MMTDKRSFDGWRRLGRAVMVEVGQDDPEGLAQVRKVLDELEAAWIGAMAELAGCTDQPNVVTVPFYSHGEIAAALGVTRQAITKRLRNR